MIPVCKPWMPGNEKKYAIEALDTNWISSSGKYIDKFEENFSDYCNVKHGVACSSGFGALHLACVALGLRKGDEVIVPTFTMIACTNAIILTGATPVLVDSDKETYCIDVERIEEKITNKTKAIMPVHIYGHSCEMDKIMEIAKKHDLYVVEDCAEAHGTEYNGEKVGGIGNIGCFSFYANKILTTGEGGMCVTNSSHLAEKMKKLRNHAFDVPRFTHKEVGFNYRLTNIQAAIGVAQVENAEMLVEARRSVGLRYDNLLKGTPGLIIPSKKSYSKNIYWMYNILLSDEVALTCEEVRQKLKEEGIDTRSFFVPMHQQPVYTNPIIENAPDCSGSFPVADKISKNGFYLPSSSDMADEEIKFVSDTLKNILDKK